MIRIIDHSLNQQLPALVSVIERFQIGARVPIDRANDRNFEPSSTITCWVGAETLDVAMASSRNSQSDRV